ncbi:hypothetical protein KSP40_PGU001703 [Platanthera guangdongensis]|uniref:Uncharacterized protein n=1 Tax=Platanthera guangdongensis TaxID=2320717 RepID=A0ABR2MAE2_9ASPA
MAIATPKNNIKTIKNLNLQISETFSRTPTRRPYSLPFSRVPLPLPTVSPHRCSGVISVAPSRSRTVATAQRPDGNRSGQCKPAPSAFLPGARLAAEGKRENVRSGARASQDPCGERGEPRRSRCSQQRSLPCSSNGKSAFIALFSKKGAAGTCRWLRENMEGELAAVRCPTVRDSQSRICDSSLTQFSACDSAIAVGD